MKDSYQEFLANFNIGKNDFYRYGLNSIIIANFDLVNAQYQSVKDKLLGNSKLTIRGYGRNGMHTDLFLELYKVLFGNDSIVIDPTNNAIPRKNISAATNYKINRDLFNYQVSHIFGKTKNPILFESVWNICFIPRMFDPFTGHECKGGWNEEFIPMLKNYIYDTFENIILDYNQFVTSNNISGRINVFAENLLLSGTYDSEFVERFRKDALSEWEIITRL